MTAASRVNPSRGPAACLRPRTAAGVRVRLRLLLAYLSFPLDLVPDFVPVVGYADDAILVVLVLRSVVRHVGVDAVRRHWPGRVEGFAALTRLTGLPTRGSHGAQPAQARSRARKWTNT